jgi:hypothetical protein
MQPQQTTKCSKTKLLYLKNPLLNRNGSITPRPCTTTDLSLVYGVNRRTVAVWLRPFRAMLGERISYYYTQKQVELIFEKLGAPRDLEWERLEMVG